MSSARTYAHSVSNSSSISSLAFGYTCIAALKQPQRASFYLILSIYIPITTISCPFHRNVNTITTMPQSRSLLASSPAYCVEQPRRAGSCLLPSPRASPSKYKDNGKRRQPWMDRESASLPTRPAAELGARRAWPTAKRSPTQDSTDLSS